MTTIHAGATLERPPGGKYRDKLHFAELALPAALPRRATLEGWAKDLSDAMTLSVVVPRVAWVGSQGPLKIDDEVREAIDRCVEAADVLGARFVVLPTDGTVTTGQRHRDRLRAWFERWPEGDRRMVWHPTGLWDAELAAPFARRLGVLHAIDPLEQDIPQGAPEVYARLRAIGLRARFTETLLLDAVDALEQADVAEAWVAIESPRSFKEAVRLAELST